MLISLLKGMGFFDGFGVLPTSRLLMIASGRRAIEREGQAPFR